MSEKKLEREVTPRHVYVNRRTFVRGGLVAASAGATALLYRKLNGVKLLDSKGSRIPGLVKATPGPYLAPEDLTPKLSILNYNNFYEFTTNKDGVAAAAKDFKVGAWKVTVDGLCHKPRTFDLDDFKKLGQPEERVYRHRCVEAWSMVIPWVGFPVKKLLDAVEPMADAKFVAMQTLFDPTRYPNQNNPDVLEWPYVEGLRIDEAMNPLAIFATGLYGEELPAQDGAPIKLVVPWKYGFKGIKAIVKISLVAQMPPTTWNKYGARQYGFYANVNPNHPHPRWTQATELRIGESSRRPTLPFNGYAEQVAGLYSGMDLDVYF